MIGGAAGGHIGGGLVGGAGVPPALLAEMVRMALPANSTVVKDALQSVLT